MQRVMIVTNSLTGGGAERSMNLVSNELTKRGWPIALVPINSSEPDLIAPTCEIFATNRQWRGSLFGTISALVKFNRAVYSWKPNVIILNTDLPELFGALLFRKQVLVVVEHSSTPWINRVRLGKVVRRILSRRGALWVAVSSHLQIWPTRQSPLAVLQNPLTVSGESTSMAIGLYLRRLVFIGRLSPEKRPDILLSIGAGVGTDIEIIGDGLMRETLQEVAKVEKLKVEFTRQVRDPWSHVGSGDLLIVPSAYEGDGLVVIEGMQHGIPMLLSDIPDFRRFALPERNYCQNVDDFVERIHQYRDDLGSLIIPENICRSLLASRSLESVGDTWESFLDVL